MPRNVRNFWVTLSVDGKKTDVATGPVRRDGGFTLSVRMRDEGDIIRVFTMEGRADDDGTLTLIAGPDNPEVAPNTVIKTRR